MRSIEIKDYQDLWDNDLYNDGVDQEMIMGWVKRDILNGKFDEYEEIIVSDCFVAPYIPYLLARKKSNLKRLEVRSHIEYCYLVEPSYKEEMFDLVCWTVLTQNDTLELEELKVLDEITEEMLAEAKTLPHLKNVIFTRID